MPLPPDKVLEELFRFRLTQLKADREYATSAISQLSRVIAYGLVALIIPFVAAEPDKLPLVVRHHPRIVFFAAFLGCVAVIFDFLQNFLADRCARQELDRLTSNLHRTEMVVSSAGEFLASRERSRGTKVRRLCFWLKVISTVVGAASIFIMIFAELVNG